VRRPEAGVDAAGERVEHFEQLLGERGIVYGSGRHDETPFLARGEAARHHVFRTMRGK
jgi:hypothetical protein